MASRSLAVEVAIIGGGVAGLWLLARLRRLGYRALLLESAALGMGQTRYAQGIIHGGTKYALTGNAGDSADAVSQMPARWRACLEGDGELDLRGVTLLSAHQYLWSTASLSSRMAGFFASKLMRSRTQSIKEEERPQLFRHAGFRGQVYRLDEPVLDTAALVRELAEPCRDAILKVEWPQGVQLSSSSAGTEITLTDAGSGVITIEARRLVLAAGRGNAALLQALGCATPAMQLRPLQMVMVRGGLPERIYAHCLGASANPRITITSHQDRQGETVWYLGGQLAEEGVGRSREEQIAVAQDEMHALFPWVDFSRAQWATLAIDRAEPRQPHGERPVGVFAEEREGVISAWPTKLALSPILADEVIALLQQGQIVPGEKEPLPPFNHPDYAPLPWQEESRWGQ